MPASVRVLRHSPLLTGRYKQKPAERVLAEIDRIIEIWPRPFLEFADDNTFVDHAYWKQLLPGLAERRVRWFAETDLSVADDDELLRLIAASGCQQLLIGLESPLEAGLAGLEMKSDWKRKHWPLCRGAIRKIQSFGITVNGCFVLGLDGQAPGVFDEVFRFVEDSGLYEVQVTVLTAFPGTPLYARLEHEGRIVEPRRWDKCTLFDVNFRPAGMTAEELSERFKALVVKLYSQEFTEWRRAQFTRQLRAARHAAPAC